MGEAWGVGKPNEGGREPRALVALAGRAAAKQAPHVAGRARTAAADRRRDTWPGGVRAGHVTSGRERGDGIGGVQDCTQKIRRAGPGRADPRVNLKVGQGIPRAQPERAVGSAECGTTQVACRVWNHPSHCWE